MKYIVLFWLLLQAGYCQAADNRFSVDFHDSDAVASRVLHIFYMRGGVSVHDSVVLRGGTAMYSGEVAGPLTVVNLRVDRQKMIALVVEPGDRIEVRAGGDPADATITGSQASVDFRTVHGELRKLHGKAVASFTVLDTFIRAHPASEGAFLAMSEAIPVFAEASRGSLLDSLRQVFMRLAPRVRDLPRAKEYAQWLDRLSQLQVGAIAPGFSTMTIDDKPLKLSDLRGKYVLLDFWASWCIPCRREFPYLKKAYARYKGKNFEIVGYSIDNDRSLWESAVSNDDVRWIQVSGLKGYPDPVAREYGIEAVPSNWLLDPQGRIVARNLRGEEVEKVLGEYIK